MNADGPKNLHVKIAKKWELNKRSIYSTFSAIMAHYASCFMYYNRQMSVWRIPVDNLKPTSAGDKFIAYIAVISVIKAVWSILFKIFR